MKRNKKPHGFTLLELLIALALFAVVMVVVASVFSTGILSWKRAEACARLFGRPSLTGLLRSLR